MQREVLLLGNLLLLKSVVKPVNVFKFKQRAIISRVTVSIDKITDGTVSVLLIACDKNWGIILIAWGM